MEKWKKQGEWQVVCLKCLRHQHWGQPNPYRVKEAYWEYHKVFEILKKYGARRTLRMEGDSEGEPSYEDAVRLPRLGFSPHNQPNWRYWQPLRLRNASGGLGGGSFRSSRDGLREC